VGVQIQNRADAAKMVETFVAHGFKTIDLTDDELTKLHLRHMVGGHFPRPEMNCSTVLSFRTSRALMKFVGSMSPDWNISSFTTATTGQTMGELLSDAGASP